MRLCNQTFLLTAEFDHDAIDKICVFDNSGNQLASGNASIQLNVTLPNRIIFRLRNCKNSRLKRMQLVGITIDSKSLLNIVEYKQSRQDINAMQELDSLPTTRTLQFNQDGYLIVNLFHPNPFALHLFIGNQIKFEL